MTYFYGSVPGGFAKTKRGRWTPYGMTKQVIEEGVSREHAKEFAHTICRTIEGMVPRAKEVRGFLESLAELCAEKNIPVRWESPLGLPVINRYHAPETKDISVSLRGKRRRVRLAIGDKPGIDKRSAVNAVTANFVHSIDAAHLQFVARAAAKEGINLVTVHDCFGTIAPRAERLNVILRQQFVSLHKRHNMLNGVRESTRRALRGDAKLPSLPAIGSANIEDVLGSFHAFK
jgi:DNA-directed RNA polymerase